MKKEKVLTILVSVLPILAVLLTALPNAVKMRFFAGGNGYFVEYVSGFARMPMGYGLISPGLAGISAILAAVFSLRGDRKRARSFAGAGAVFWCLCGLQGGLTRIGAAAFMLLAVTAGIAHYLLREETR